MRLLLDVNVWLALLSERHAMFPSAEALFDRPGLKIATTPLVENGVIRLLNTPAMRGVGLPQFQATADALARAYASVDTQKWPDDISLVDDPTLIDWRRVTGHHQVTDLYLLALAVKHDAALASFDQRITWAAVRGAKARHLVLL